MYIEGELTSDHIIALQKNFITTFDPARRLMNNARTLITVLFLGFLFFIHPSSHPLQIRMYIISALLLAILMSILIQNVVIRHLSKEIIMKETESFILHITEKGIYVKKASGNMLMEWANIQRMSSDEENFFIYDDDLPAMIIPKQGNFSAIELRDMLTTYIDKSKIDTKTNAARKVRKTRVMIIGLVVILVLLIVAQRLFVNV